MNAWILASNYHGILTNPLNIFETNIFYPLTGTLTFSDPLIAPVILFFPLFSVIQNVILLHNIVLLSNYVFAAFFMYLLAYELRRCWRSAFLAGFVYAFCHFSLSHIHWVQLAPQWIPFTLLFLIRYRNTQSFSSLGFFCLGILLQLYTGLYHFVYLVLGLSLFFIFFLTDLFQVAGEKKRYIIGLVVGGVVTLLLASPLLYVYSSTHDHYNLARILNDWMLGGASWKDYLMPLQGSPLYKYFSQHFSVSSLYWEKALFPGVLAVFFAIFSLLSIPFQKKGYLSKNSYCIYFFLMGLFFLFLSFGPNRDGSCTWYSLFSGWVPGLEGIRVPARAGIMVMLSIAVLSSFGLSLLFKWLKSWNHMKTVVFLLCLSFTGWEYWVPVDRVGRNIYEAEETIPPVYQWIKENVNNDVLVELPFGNVGSETLRMYYSTFHWKKMVNGYSGYPSGYQRTLARAGAGELSSEAIKMLRDENVRYVIFDKSKAKPPKEQVEAHGLKVVWESNTYMILDILN